MSRWDAVTSLIVQSSCRPTTCFVVGSAVKQEALQAAVDDAGLALAHFAVLGPVPEAHDVKNTWANSSLQHCCGSIGCGIAVDSTESRLSLTVFLEA